MNKKKIYIIALLVILMFIIVCMKNLFIQDIKEVAISNNNIKNFDEYLLGEGEYKVSLPEGWEIDKKIKSFNGDININFSDNDNIEGNISIEKGNIEDISFSITNSKENIKIIEDNYIWHIINVVNNKTINKYYLRSYSEGKVLIIKYSYIKEKEKNSINVVFDSISMSFK